MLENRQKLTVATSFDGNENELVSLGQRLAKAFNKKLNLIHVCEPWFGSYAGLPIAGSTPIWTFGNEIRVAQYDAAVEHLKKLQSEFEASESTTNVYEGDAEKWITADSQNSYITILGMNPSETVLGRKFSTVARVLAHSQSPTAVVPRGWQWPEKKGIKILITDDLETDSTTGIDFALNLAKTMKNCSLVHTHVSGLTLENLTVALQTANAVSHTSTRAKPSPEDIHAEAMNNLKLNLERCTEKVSRGEFEASGCAYEAKILTGNPAEEIEKLRDEWQPDIEIYGRHRAIHLKPFGFGAMPINSMIQGKSLVIVVPDQHT